MVASEVLIGRTKEQEAVAIDVHELVFELSDLKFTAGEFLDPLQPTIAYRLRTADQLLIQKLLEPCWLILFGCLATVPFSLASMGKKSSYTVHSAFLQQ